MHDAKNTVNLILDFYKVLEYFRHLGPDWSGDPTGALHMYRASSDLRIVISRRSGGEGGEVSKMHAVIPAIYPLTKKRRRSDGEATEKRRRSSQW